MLPELLTLLVWDVASRAAGSIEDLLEAAVELGVGLPRFKVIPSWDERGEIQGEPDVVILTTETFGERARVKVSEAQRRLPRTPIVVIAEEGTAAQAEHLAAAGVACSLLRRELGGSLLARALVHAVESRPAMPVKLAWRGPCSRSGAGSSKVERVDAVDPCEDTSDRDLRTRSLQVRDECFRAALETLPDPVAFVELDGTVRLCNHYTAKLYGRDHPEELIGRNAFCLIAPEDRPPARKDLARLLAGERVQTVAYRALKCDGTHMFVEIRAKVVRGPGGEPVGFLGSIRDVTELRRVEEALAGSRADYRRLVENTSDLVCEIDEAGRFVYLNPQYEAALGYKPEALVHTDSKALIHPDDLVAAQRKHARLLEDEGRSIDEWRFRHSDGTWRWLECTGKTYRTPSGEIRTVVISRDITERKQTERALRAALRDKTVLLQEVHHRVKNNLAVVVSLLGLQAMTVEDPAAQQALWESRQRIEAMARVHEHLYRSPKVSRVDMAAYVGRLSRDMKRSMGLPDLEVRLDVAPLHLEIGRAIPCALVLNELMTNALRHGFLRRRASMATQSSPAEGRPSIGISLQRSDGGVELVVRNNGRPLPADFDLTSCDSLGLSLVKLLAEQLEGRLSVSEDAGVAFHLKFPLPPDDLGSSNHSRSR